LKFPNIEAERARLGLTKADLADLIGVSYRTFYNWEQSGKFQLDAMQRMAELFNCSLDYLAQTKEENE